MMGVINRVADTGKPDDFDNQELMEAISTELSKSVDSIHQHDAGNEKSEEMERIAQAKAMMSTRERNQSDGMQDALKLLAAGGLPKNHRALQSARRAPALQEMAVAEGLNMQDIGATKSCMTKFF